MAGPLLMWVLALTAVSGCFWPQDDQVFSEIPPKRNSPPRIIPDTVYPATVDVTYGPNCDLPFSVVVEDQDVSDLIRVKWFVYAPGGTPVVSFDGKQLSPGTTAIRSIAAAAKDAPALKSPASELIQNGEHRLEVVVADGEFSVKGTDYLATADRERPMPDGGTETDHTYTDSYVWVVKTNSTLSCP